MADIEAGKLDAVVVYKVDRLSRSLLDFARMMASFEKHSISFVSVTQQFNTAQSMGRLMLNVLLSFAQFEREIISERTRDKIAAARRKGMWSGGKPVLGYDLVGGKLKVNPAEAERVREIFAIYLKKRSLNRAVDELNARGWATKAWTNKKGVPCGGRPFHKSRLRLLLGNVAYLGKVRHHAAVFPGEQGVIVDEDVFDKVQALLRDNGGEDPRIRRGHTSLLGGLVFCAPCNKPMTHACSRVRGVTYRYYVCHGAQTKGRATCPTPSLPAQALERIVLARVEQQLGLKAPRSPREGPSPSRDAPHHPHDHDLRRLVRRVEYDGRQVRITLTNTAGVNTGDAA